MLQSRLGLDAPLIQAPMAGVQDHQLAAAVCQAGGLGSLPGALFNAQALRQQLQALTAQIGTRPYNVNFFCHRTPDTNTQRQAVWLAALAPYFEAEGLPLPSLPPVAARQPFDAQALAVLAEFKPPVVSFHFGLPDATLLAGVRQWGPLVLGCATTVQEALWLQAQGVDAVVAQGLEAGGHRGLFLSDDLHTQLGTLALVRQIARAIRLPVIAAGGIADAAGVQAALALGAAGVQVGTAYLLCPEATTSAIHRATLQSEAAHHTALTNLFTGRPARGLVNRLMRELGPVSALAPAFPLAAGALAPLRAQAESQGRGDFSPLWAGQNAPLCQSRSAAEVTRALAGWEAA